MVAREENYEVVTQQQAQVSMFLNEQRFEFAQRIGKMLASSTMIPEQFRNNIGNCLIALNLSERLGIDVFGLMQTSFVVHGRPGFEAKLLIALFNSKSMLFKPPLRWEMKGDFPKGKDAACRAYAIDKETGEILYGEWIDWQLVKAEGWDSKAGSKWLTMPGQMFRYRAASWFINVYEPGLKMGIMTLDELEDMAPVNVTPKTLKIEGAAVEELPASDADDPYKVQELPEDPPPAPEQATAESSPVDEGQSKAPEEKSQPEPKQKGKATKAEKEKAESEAELAERTAFVEEAEKYKEVLPAEEWVKLLGAFMVESPAEVKPTMRQAFIRTAKSRLDHVNGERVAA